MSRIKWIPVDLCTYALQKKRSNELSLLITLKSISSGWILRDDIIKRELNKDLGIHSRTIINRLNRLDELKWIGIDGEVIYLRSFTRIRKIIGSKSRRCVEFYPGFIQNFKPYLIGGFIGNLTLIQAKKEGAGLEGANRQTSNQRPAPNFFPVANMVISHILDVSLSTAHRYKHEAEEKNFIAIKKVLILQKNISIKSLLELRKLGIEDVNRLIIKDRRVYERRPDLVRSMLQLRKK